MGYSEALKEAGAVVLSFEQFGSYQGDWWAVVRYNDRKGWIKGSYGSCSGCDAFEAEFGYEDGKCPKHQYMEDREDNCHDCYVAAEQHRFKLAAFGREYLDDIKTQAEAVAAASAHLDWDVEAKEMVDHIVRVGKELGVD